MKRIFAMALLALPLVGGSVPPAKPEEAGMSGERLQRIHETVQRHMDAGAVTGAVTLVARRGKVAHFEAHGLMDLESKKPMAKDTIFRLASMSKPVTGVAVMMLLEEGKVRLSDPVSKFIPEVKDMKVAVARNMPPRPPGQPAAEPQYYLAPADREITVRDLLTHTSGLGSGGLSTPVVAKVLPRSGLFQSTLAQMSAKLGELPLDFQPGSLWRYSGLLGIDALARIVEVASGMSYEQFLKQRLFDPLGMKDTSFYVPAEKRPRLVTLYQRTPGGGSLTKSENQEGLMSQTYFSGAGGLTSTAEDYLQFAQMLVNGGTLGGRRYLGPRTVELMASNHVGEMFNGQLGRPAKGMGFGLTVAVIQDSVAAGLRVSNGSFGWDGAFGTQVWIDPKEKMVSIVMMQTQTPQLQRDFENAVMQAIID
jgi:CubicO group peptidase (beta-lactamase class C family)